MKLKCKIVGHKYLAGNPIKIQGGSDQYSAACIRIGCGSPAILTVWGGSPAQEIILYEPSKRWKTYEGPIPSWAKIVVS